MFNNKEQKPKQDDKPKGREHIKPGEIIGKIDIHDDRERRDGPGGN